jgi:hypothetical protein
MIMVQQCDPEHLYTAAQAEAHSVLSMHGRPAPPPLQGEPFLRYDRRLTDEVKRYAPNFKDVSLHDAGGATYPILKKQVFADALQEARRPTMIPEGELREVKRVDQSGRPFSEFYGSPRAWLNDFSAPKKRLAAINAPLSFTPV